jgi:hypothetical protein
MTNSNETRNTKQLDQRARRSAERVGLKAIKSRKRCTSIDNYGGFMIIDPARNWVEAGNCFDLSADEVIVFCEGN